MVARLLQSIKSTFLKNSKGFLIFFLWKLNSGFTNFLRILEHFSGSSPTAKQEIDPIKGVNENESKKERRKKKNCGLYHFRHYCDVDDEILGSGNLRNSLKASIQNEIDQQQQQKEKFNCFVDFRLSTVTMDSIFAHGSFDCRRCAGSTRFILY